MVDIEVDDGDALGAVLALRMARRDRHIVEQAKTHRPRGERMMAARTDRYEGVGGPAAHHRIDRMHRAADGAQRRLEASRRHRGVRVQPNKTLLRGRVAKRGHVVERVNQGDGLEACGRRLLADQRLEGLVGERSLDRAQPVGPLRMAGRSEVEQASRMADEERRHCRFPPIAAPRGPHVQGMDPPNPW